LRGTDSFGVENGITMTDKNNPTNDIRLSELIVASLEGTITAAQFGELQDKISGDPRAAEMYVNFILNHAIITQRKETANPVENDLRASATDWEFWKELAEIEKTSPTVEIPPSLNTNSALPVSYNNRIERVTRPVNKYTLMTAIISVAAVIMLIVLVQFYGGNSQSAVATLIDSHQAQWADTSADYTAGKRLSTGSDLNVLKSGIVKITFDYGTEVIIEGPAMFSLRSAEQLYLADGKAYTYVPQRATGFIVETPSSKVVDLGTEFGISVDSRGESLIQMYRGKASVISGRRGQTLSQVLLTEGNAGKVDSETGQFTSAIFDRNAFVQSFDSQKNLVWHGEKINLADMVGGGNGMGTGKLNAGINYNGNVEILNTQTSTDGPKTYIRTPSSGFIDGIFIPNAMTTITSTNLSYDFGKTNGRYWLGVLNGAWHQVSITSKVPHHNLRLDGKVYGIEGNPAIGIDANQGITFDLDAIRAYYRLSGTIRFTALCGISETYNEYLNTLDKKFYSKDPKASFYVLIDGEPRFEKVDMTPSNSAEKIELSIMPRNRFLTLVATQGTDGTNNGDWTLFAEPALQVK
jgi:hypothetical protein